MKRLFFLIALSFITLTAIGEELYLGKKDAPITLIEYGSITCDSCLYFHREVLPKIKANYIDTGKVRFIYRHFPTGEAAMQGAIAAQCAGDQYYEMLDNLFLSVANWYDADNQNQLLISQAGSLGINEGEFGLCLEDHLQKEDVLAQQRYASQQFGVRGTPTFIINNEIVRGKRSFSQMEELLNKVP